LTDSYLYFSFESESDCVLINDSNDWKTSKLLFMFTHRSNSAEDTDFAFHIFYLIMKSFPN
jgi:hypothetical protein